ncbi:MAG: hypothetical protein WKG07_46670 [Hymenobacter sp.]
MLCCLLAAPLPILAQGVLAGHYDTSKRVLFAGTVDAVIMPPGELPVCFLMTVQNNGKSEQWVVAGDVIRVLMKAGWRFGPAGQVKPGRSTSVSVFLPKPASTAAQTLGVKLREKPCRRASARLLTRR